MDEPARSLLDLFPLLEGIRRFVVDLALSAGRFMGLVAVMPVFKRTELGRAFLAMVAFGLALPIMGGLAPRIAALPTDELWFLVVLTLKEFAVGALMGLLFGVPFWAIQAVGEIVDNQRSIGQSGLSDPATGSEASVTSSLLSLVAITLFVSEGGLSMMAATVYGSYAIWDLGLFAPEISVGALGEVAGVLGRIALFGLLVAAPFVIVFLLSDLAAMALARLGGRINVALTLPLVKNILFVLFALAYLEFMVGYLRTGLEQARVVGPLLETIVGR